MESFFKPQSVAVIGVSESPQNMARNIVGNLIEFGFKGIIYQVGRNAGTLFSRKIYQSILDIEDPVDLAVILTPAATIPGIMEECGKKGVKRVIVESAGFREFGDEGKILEEKIVKIAKKYGIRFIGPNCIGTHCTQSGLGVAFVSFKNIFRSGGISIVSQSGGVGFSYLMILASENLGIAKFASIGNKLNVDENDLLEYLIEDSDTEIICLYLEGITDGRRLMEIASRSTKPILVQKANIGTHAKSIAQSHTAALSSDDAVVDAALKQAGIARVLDKETLVNYLKIMPLPRMRGNRLAIISRSGGHAIIAADASEKAGFDLAPLSAPFLKSIEKHFRAKVIKLTNPLDIGDLFDYDVYVDIIDKTLAEDYVDGVVFMHTYFVETEGEKSRQLFRDIEALSIKHKKPVGICIATDEAEYSRLRKDLDYPLFSVPVAVINALALSRDFYLRQLDRRHSKPSKKMPVHPATKAGKEAGRIIRACIKARRSPLLQEGMEIFEDYGIPIVKSTFVKDAAAAAKAAAKAGYPAAMKILSKDISHKTDFGGVKLNLKNAEDVRCAYAEMMKAAKHKAPKAKIEGVVIQPMLKKGWELILGARHDPNFGPIVLAGLGGIFVEIFKDSAIRVVPFDRREAREMLEGLKGYPILAGARGEKPYDIEAIEDAILKLSRLIADFPEIKEIDINPFYVLRKGKGGYALDARIIL
ncbi:MAG: acetate--CoA ligase family protein [Pseudomonadota bacterium]